MFFLGEKSLSFFWDTKHINTLSVHDAEFLNLLLHKVTTGL